MTHLCVGGGEYDERSVGLGPSHGCSSIVHAVDPPLAFKTYFWPDTSLMGDRIYNIAHTLIPSI